MKTLIVEDDMMSQCVLAKILAERGHEVTSYDNAEQAILAYQKEFYPLLFVDVDLPGMDGLHFCKWVRAQPEGDKVFIMVATSSGQPEDLGEVLAVGANDFLPKPYDVGALGVRLTIAEAQMDEFFERKALEDALRDSQQSCQRLFRTANEGALLLNSQFHTEYVNPQMAAMLGYQPEELADRAVIDFLPESVHRETEDWFALQRDGNDLKMEIHFRRKDGSDCLGLLSAAPVLTESGAFVGALWMVADLTGRKNMEIELADTRKKLEAQLRDATGELNQIRQSLQTESAERKKVEQTLQQARIDSEARSRAESSERSRVTDELKTEAAARRKLEGQLAKIRDELAGRVQEFTTELNQKNDALQAEIHRRKESEEALRELRKLTESQLQQQEDELTGTVKELKAEQARVKQTEDALERARADAELRSRQHAEELNRADQSLQAEIADRKRLADVLHQAQVQSEARSKQQADELVRVHEKLATQTAELRKLEQDLARTRGELEGRAAALAAELDQAKQDLTERGLELTRTREELEARQRTLDQAREELKTALAGHQRAQIRYAAVLKLATELNVAGTANDAARLLAGVAHQLLGWDACSFELYSAEENKIDPLLNIDTVNGRPAEIPPTHAGPEPSPLMRKVLADGPQLILRSAPSDLHTDFLLFGDRARLSASLMYIPVRAGSRIVGFFSIQSYAPGAYKEDDLILLQTLADLSGRALDRIRSGTTQQRSIVQGEISQGGLLAASLDAIVAIDHDGKVSEWNSAAEKMFGHRRKDVLGKDLAELIIPEAFRARHRAGLNSAREGTSGAEAMLDRRIELRAIRADGTEFPVEMTVTRLTEDGAPGFGAFIRDISERVSKEAELRRVQKMESIGQLAGGVAHDFNNLLGVVQGYSALLMEEKGLAPEASEALKQIAVATERATYLTRQLLTVGHKQVMHPRVIDLNELINNVGKLVRRATGENIALQFNYSPNVSAVEADPDMIEQLVMHLANNARDAMPQGGQLTVATKVTTIDQATAGQHSEARAGRFVCLTMADTGCGMDEATLERIFEPFFTTKPSGKGSGLGLALVHGIVKQHQGWIEVRTKVGQGTNFQVYLPASSKAVELPRPPENKPPVRGGQETILLVDDEPAVLAMATGILQRLGYQVVPATSGDEAASIWQHDAARIDLLLTDMVMPGSLNGRELAEKLSQEKPGLKIVYTSGYSLDLVGPGLATQKNFIFVPKPYHPDELAQTVRNCLDGKVP